MAGALSDSPAPVAGISGAARSVVVCVAAGVATATGSPELAAGTSGIGTGRRRSNRSHMAASGGLTLALHRSTRPYTGALNASADAASRDSNAKIFDAFISSFRVWENRKNRRPNFPKFWKLANSHRPVKLEGLGRMSSAPQASTHYMPMAAPPPRPPMRSTAGPSPRLGPAQTPTDDMQFSMDLEDGSASASVATQPVAPRTIQSEGAAQKKHTHDGSSAPSRSRSTGGSRRDSRRGSFDAQAERMEKRPRLSTTGSAR